MILYKYLTVEKAYDWLIGEDSILLTPPIYLNDLLEFRVRREPPDVNERRALFEKFQIDTPSRLSYEEYERETTKQEFLDREPVELRELFSKTFGVISLSSDPVNELMWAHYGLNSGVAIGYLSNEIGENEVFRCSFMPLGDAIEVTYKDSVAPMKKDCSDAVTQLTRKRECWRYEKEWRIVKRLAESREVRRNGKTFYCLPARPDTVVHVVFGANSSEDFIEKISAWLQPNTPILQKLQIDPNTQNLVPSDMKQTN